MTNFIPIGYDRVTDILSPFVNFYNIDPEVLANAADRGRRVHGYCESYALGLMIGDVDDDCLNYFKCFQSWFDKAVEKVLYTECRLNLEKYKLSGAFDLLVVLKGDSKPSLIDLKTPATESHSWQLQTAAYQILIKEILGLEVDRRICLMLPKNGPFPKIIEYLDHKRDQELYLKALELYRFFKLK